VRLADTHKLITNEFTGGAGQEIGTGELTITAGSESFSVTLDESSKTLAGIRDAINNAPANNAVTASIINVDGAGSVDSTRFDAVLEDNFDDLAELFAGENGVANRLDERIDTYLSLHWGNPGAHGRSRPEYISDRESLDQRMASLEDRLLQQFTAMDTLVAQLRTTGYFHHRGIEEQPGP
jgi:flagellar capping protein FliD